MCMYVYVLECECVRWAVICESMCSYICMSVCVRCVCLCMLVYVQMHMNMHLHVCICECADERRPGSICMCDSVRVCA